MMKKILTVAIVATLAIVSQGQTAMQLKGADCNGMEHDLYADLDAGKAVILHFFMANCGSCPPPAKKIQKMANTILAKHPGKVVAYAMPYENTTTCTYTANWVSQNGLQLYAPYDSGAAQVAHYGGFGMPTVVLLGGKDHRVMFASQAFVTSDTTEMRDSILALLSGSVGVAQAEKPTAFGIVNKLTERSFVLNMNLDSRRLVLVKITGMDGKTIQTLMNEPCSGNVSREFSTASLPSGSYAVVVESAGSVSSQPLVVFNY